MHLGLKIRVKAHWSGHITYKDAHWLRKD